MHTYEKQYGCVSEISELPSVSYNIDNSLHIHTVYPTECTCPPHTIDQVQRVQCGSPSHGYTCSSFVSCFSRMLVLLELRHYKSADILMKLCSVRYSALLSSYHCVLPIVIHLVKPRTTLISHCQLCD